MKTTLHHVHLFASDLEKSIQFYCDMFGAKVIFDREMAGARNVLISILIQEVLASIVNLAHHKFSQ